MAQYTYSQTRINELVNDTNLVFLETMYQEDIISKAQFQQMHAYSIVIHEKGFFGRVWDKVWGDKKSMYFRIVKIIGHREDLLRMTQEY